MFAFLRKFLVTLRAEKLLVDCRAEELFSTIDISSDIFLNIVHTLPSSPKCFIKHLKNFYLMW